MLKITIERNSNIATLKLAGKLAGPWIEELERTWSELIRHTIGSCVVLDLSDVTFVAPEGRTQLKTMCEQGASFKTSGCLGKSIVEGIMRDLRKRGN
jgi:hypothetical protein